MIPHYADDAVTLYAGDCLDVMRELPDNSVDAVVTDPPYGLEFMGREWDTFARQDTTAQRGNAGGFGYDEGKPWNKARSGTKGVRSTFRCRKCRGWSGSFSEARAARQKACACDAPDFDYAGAPAQTVAFGHWCELWATECLRLLKPGGHLLAFGGTRTHHRLACAIEDAGFEIRDSIAWLYASGFPKSLDVSKAIDRAAGAEREVVGTKLGQPGYSLTPGRASTVTMGTVGQGGDPEAECAVTAPATDDAKRWAGWGTALKPAHEPIVVARKPLAGTVAANVLTWGTGALNIDGCRVGSNPGWSYNADRNGTTFHGEQGARDPQSADKRGASVIESTAGRWPSNVVLDDTQAEELDRQSGMTRVGGPRLGPSANPETAAIHGGGVGVDSLIGYGDVGGSSRFFPTFRYEAKAPTAERPRDDRPCDVHNIRRCTICLPQAGVAHPTVKPLDLMRWLVRLVTPPGGVVLEPFAGSGTTAEACVIEGFQCVAIEREADYLPLIVARLSKPIQPDLFGGAA